MVNLDTKFKNESGQSIRLLEISSESKCLSELSVNRLRLAVKKGFPIELYGVTAYLEDNRCPDTLVFKAEINDKQFYASIITGQLFTEDGECKTGQGITIKPGSRKVIQKKQALKWISQAGVESNFTDYGRTSYYMLTNSSKPLK